jgi:hypothetical protein
VSEAKAPLPATREPPVADAFAPLAGWMAASIALLMLASFGPNLWATQRTDNAAIAIEIVVAGQLLLAMIAWPIWARTASVAVAVVAGSAVWLLLAGQLAQRSNADVLSLAWKLAAALAVLAVVRAAMPRRAVGFAWTLLLAIALGVPALVYLARDFPPA